MMRALYSAATGMIAQQYNMDTISNNLANVDTAGFKGNFARFQDLIYQNIQSPGAPIGPSIVPVGQQVGLGVKVGSSEKIFTQGSLLQTGNPLDTAIEGDGFFQVTLPDGTTAYTRDGSFKQDANGAVVTADGYFLQPQITIPQNAIPNTFQIGSDGTVTVASPRQRSVDAATRADHARALRQQRRPGAARAEPLHADVRQRTADRRPAGPQRRGYSAVRVSRELERADRQ